jgi:hypothetical protein
MQARRETGRVRAGDRASGRRWRRLGSGWARAKAEAGARELRAYWAARCGCAGGPGGGGSAAGPLALLGRGGRWPSGEACARGERERAGALGWDAGARVWAKERWAAELGRGGPGEGFLFLLFYIFLLSNLFTMNELHIKWIHPKAKHHTKQIYFGMMHQSLFPWGFINSYNWSKISYNLGKK